MFVIGLTGGIGAGKSTAAGFLKELGAEVIDADAVAHEAYAPGTPAWEAIVDRFGGEMLAPDGRIDRKRLGAIVFENAEARERLNAIVHPSVRRLLEERISAHRREGAGVVVVEAALLIEAMRSQPRWTSMLDEVWVVTAPPERAIARAVARGGLSESAIRARMASQISDGERSAGADALIDNSGGLDGLRQQVTNLWRDRAPRDIGSWPT